MRWNDTNYRHNATTVSAHALWVRGFGSGVPILGDLGLLLGGARVYYDS